MALPNSSASEVKSWLTVVLAKENIENLAVKNSGSTEKGEGYVADVIFAVATGTDKQGLKKEYDLVLKRNKSSSAELPALREACKNEIYVYDKIFPLFKKFQVDRGIDCPFDSVAKCYGTYSDESSLVIVLDNLKSTGYDLWSKDKPLTRQHIDFIIKEYGKFHAISVAMKEQEPDNFQKLATGLIGDAVRDIFQLFVMGPTLEHCVQDLHDLLKNELDDDVLKKWLTFKKQIQFICDGMTMDDDDLQVILHGDCWSNNLMFKYKDQDLSKVAMLDWQMSKVSSPVMDLSYFLFACISEEDITSMDIILKDYYDSFFSYLGKLGSNFAAKYSEQKFFDEWRKYSKYGLMMCLLPIRGGYAKKENLPDVGKSEDSAATQGKSFIFDVEDQIGYKKRMRPIIKHAADFDLI